MMSTGDLIAICTVIGVVVGIVTWWTTRSIGRTANRIAQKQVDLDVLVATSETLERNLSRSEAKAVRLNAALDAAIKEGRRWKAESAVAWANQLILSNYIHRRLPGEPLPKLQEVSDDFG